MSNPAPKLAPLAAIGRTGWTPERVAMLEKLWADGLSASQIAKQLRGVTRNAVIGKVVRLGLAGRKPAAAPQTRVQRPQQPKAPSFPVRAVLTSHMSHTAILKPPTPLVERQEPAGCCTILTVRDGQCRWPIGSPDDADFSLCGAQASKGRPYCTDHHQRAVDAASSLSASSLAALTKSIGRYA